MKRRDEIAEVAKKSAAQAREPRGGSRASPMRKGGYPFLQLAVRDLLTREDYQLLTLEAKGLLFDCILRSWSNGSISSSPADLGRLVGAPPEQVAAVLPLIAGFCSAKSGRLVLPMLDAERRRVRERSEKKAHGGRVSGNRRREAAAERKRKQELVNACSTTVEQTGTGTGTGTEHEQEQKRSGGRFTTTGTRFSDALLEAPVLCTDLAGAPDAALAVGALASGAGCSADRGPDPHPTPHEERAPFGSAAAAAGALQNPDPDSAAHFETGDPRASMTPEERESDLLESRRLFDITRSKLGAAPRGPLDQRTKLNTPPRGTLDERAKTKLVEFFAAGPRSESYNAGLLVLRQRCVGQNDEWYRFVADELAGGNHQELPPIERFDAAVAVAHEALRGAKEA